MNETPKEMRFTTTEQSVKAESWIDFHSRHHSEEFRYSSRNERNLGSLLSVNPPLYSEPCSQSWLTSLLDSLYYDESRVYPGDESSECLAEREPSSTDRRSPGTRRRSMFSTKGSSRKLRRKNSLKKRPPSP